jgi:hypothetical protein
MAVLGGGFNWSTQHFTLTIRGGVIAMRKKYIRVGFTAAQSSELWDRWRTGEGLTSIGRSKSHATKGKFAVVIFDRDAQCFKLWSSVASQRD